MYSIKEIDAKTLDVIKMFMSEIGLEKHPDPNAVNIVVCKIFGGNVHYFQVLSAISYKVTDCVQKVGFT